MKINKLIVNFFIAICFLIQVYGAEDSGDRDSKLQYIQGIKSQISSLQTELDELESPNLQEYPDNNAINVYLSVSQTTDIDDETIVMPSRPIRENVIENKLCKDIVCCTCTTLAIAGIALFSYVFVIVRHIACHLR